MANDLVTVKAKGRAVGHLVATPEKAKALIDAADADNTRRAYAAAWGHFTAWCSGEGRQPLPADPATLLGYVVACAGSVSVSTMQVRRAAIIHQHRRAGVPQPRAIFDHPAIVDAWKGLRRTTGAAPKKKAAARTVEVRAMVATLPDNLIGTRNRALLLAGFMGAMRRSELVALDIADLELRAEGFAVTLRKSKTDQEGQGVQLAIAYGSDPATCPVRSLQAWIAAAGITEGALFRSINRHGQIGERLSDKSVATIVKETAEAAGLDGGAAYAGFSGHSLRAGFITTAADAGAPIGDIQRQSRHKSVDVLLGYVRAAELFKGNAATRLGL